MRVKSVIVIVFCFLLSGTAQADQCIHKSDNVVNTSFGSFEQGQLLQEKLRKDCNFIGIQALRAVDSRRKQLVFVAYDVAAEKLFRLKMDLNGFKFESWRGITKDNVLSDDPSDGIDGGLFYASSHNENPSNEYLTQQIVSFYMDALKSGAAEALR